MRPGTLQIEVVGPHPPVTQPMSHDLRTGQMHEGGRMSGTARAVNGATLAKGVGVFVSTPCSSLCIYPTPESPAVRLRESHGAARAAQAHKTLCQCPTAPPAGVGQSAADRTGPRCRSRSRRLAHCSDTHPRWSNRLTQQGKGCLLQRQAGRAAWEWLHREGEARLMAPNGGHAPAGLHCQCRPSLSCASPLAERCRSETVAQCHRPGSPCQTCRRCCRRSAWIQTTQQQWQPQLGCCRPRLRR